MKLILENWKKFLIQEKMTNLVRYPDQDGWELYAKLVADAYREAPAFEERAQESFELLAPFYDKMHKRITRKAVKPRPVDYHPYEQRLWVKFVTFMFTMISLNKRLLYLTDLII